MAEETTIHHDNNIHVTNLRAILQGKTYAMANVTSVSMHTEPHSKFPGIVIAVLGGLFFLIGFGAEEIRGCFFTIGLPLALVGVLYAISQHDLYWVRIGSASGETNALSSRDRNYIWQIVSAMNEAIVRRG